MAKLSMDGKDIPVDAGASIIPACEQMDIPFGCKNGSCGTCLVEITQGGEFLTDKNEAESDMGIEGNQRLCCQCKIKQDAPADATVRIKV